MHKPSTYEGLCIRERVAQKKIDPPAHNDKVVNLSPLLCVCVGGAGSDLPREIQIKSRCFTLEIPLFFFFFVQKQQILKERVDIEPARKLFCGGFCKDKFLLISSSDFKEGRMVVFTSKNTILYSGFIKQRLKNRYIKKTEYCFFCRSIKDYIL